MVLFLDACQPLLSQLQWNVPLPVDTSSTKNEKLMSENSEIEINHFTVVIADVVAVYGSLAFVRQAVLLVAALVVGPRFP